MHACSSARAMMSLLDAHAVGHVWQLEAHPRVLLTLGITSWNVARALNHACQDRTQVHRQRSSNYTKHAGHLV